MLIDLTKIKATIKITITMKHMNLPKRNLYKMKPIQIMKMTAKLMVTMY